MNFKHWSHDDHLMSQLVFKHGCFDDSDTGLSMLFTSHFQLFPFILFHLSFITSYFTSPISYLSSPISQHATYIRRIGCFLMSRIPYFAILIILGCTCHWTIHNRPVLGLHAANQCSMHEMHVPFQIHGQMIVLPSGTSYIVEEVHSFHFYVLKRQPLYLQVKSEAFKISITGCASSWVFPAKLSDLHKDIFCIHLIFSWKSLGSTKCCNFQRKWALLRLIQNKSQKFSQLHVTFRLITTKSIYTYSLPINALVIQPWPGYSTY